MACTVALAACFTGPILAEADPAIPPQYVGAPLAWHSVTNRGFTGIPSLAIAPGGRLWATWYAGITPGEDDNTYVVLTTSGDNGKTWEEVLVVDPDAGGPRRTFDPELWLAPDGKLRLTWTERHSADFPTDSLWMLEISNPDSEASPCTPPVRITDGVMMCKPLVLTTGEWALPVYKLITTPGVYTKPGTRMVVSTDQGKTWSIRGSATIPDAVRSFDEHMFVERKDGSLWMLARTQYGIGESVSHDRGVTWPDIAPSTLMNPSSRFFIRRLASGNLLLVKNGPPNQQTSRSQLTAYISNNDGASWQGGLLLDEREGVSYPDGQQDNTGLIRIVYDLNRISDRMILMASFREEDVLTGQTNAASVSLRQIVSQGSLTTFHMFVFGKSSANPSELWHYAGSGTNFILVNKIFTNINFAGGMTYGPDNNLYATVAAASAPPAVKRSSGFSPVGATEALFLSSNDTVNLTGPRALDFRANGDLYVADYAANSVKWFNTNGTPLGSFAFDGVFALDVGSDDALYVGSNRNPTGIVARLDWSGSAWIQTWAVSNLFSAQSVRQHGDYVYLTTYTAANQTTSAVVKVSAATGQILGTWPIPSALGLVGMDFAPDGNLYITANASSVVVRCVMDLNGDVSGTPTIVLSGLSFPRGLTIVTQPLIAEYKFNETGTSALGSGWDTMPMTLFNASSNATDLHGTPGSGILGGLGRPGSDTDRAFNNTASTGMGTNGVGGWAQHTGDCESVDSFVSFTMSGWFKTDATTPLTDAARLLDKRDASAFGYSCLGVKGAPGKLETDLSVSALGTTVASWSNTQTWVFFAITYDGTRTNQNLKYYRGYRTADDIGGADPSVALMETLTANIGTISNSTAKLTLGNAPAANIRPFDGFLDNIRIYGSQVPGDSSGALSMGTLEAFRLVDMANPPVISTFAATAISSTAATLNGYLSSTGVSPTYVTVYWGTTDGGTNARNWQHTNAFPNAQTVGPLATNVTLASSNATYYYRYFATNASASVWSLASASFVAGDLTIVATDPSAAEEGPDTGAFTVSRSPWATNEALIVNYTVGGTALPGTDYNALSGSVIIPAGSNSAMITVAPIPDRLFESAKTVTLNLVSGLYALGAANAATVTIAADNSKTWQQQAQITFSGYTKSETLTNFPVLVRFGGNITGFDYNQFLSGSNSDLRFADATQTNELNYEIDTWDTNGTSYVWVQVPALADTNTSIWAYWGKAGLTTPAYTTSGATWSNGYVLVAHLAQASGSERDSSPFFNHSAVPSVNVNQSTAGVIGTGVGLTSNANNSYVNFGNTGVPSNSFTIGMWVKTATAIALASENTSGFDGLTAPQQYAWQPNHLAGTDCGVGLTVGTNGVQVAEHADNYMPVLASYTYPTADSGWNYIVVAYSNKQPRIYRNGILARTGLASLRTTVYPPNRIGTDLNFVSSLFFSGSIDEARLATGTRSANWIWAEWMNMASNSVFATTHNYLLKGTVFSLR